MPEFSDMQIRMLALDHAIKISNEGEDANEVILNAKAFESYIRAANKAVDESHEAH